MSYGKKDVKRFNELLRQAELKGFNNYNRNIARIKLTAFLKCFSKKDQNEMAKKIGAYRI